MKNIIVRTLIMICIMFTSIFIFVSAAEIDEKEKVYSIKQDLLVLMLSYPKYISDIEKDYNGKIYIIMNTGDKILYDDGIVKNAEEKFYKGDIQDFLEDRYPMDDIECVMKEGCDPGRGRCYRLLYNVYGRNKNEVEKNLVTISTKCGSVIFNSANDGAANLKKALDEVGDLINRDSKVAGYVYPISGTFNYRVIQDTGMLSPHAFGIAIDLNRNDSDYWKWVDKEKGSRRIKGYPKELVKIFEKYGFVWGGKWNHFDILHFEYKPEIIMKAKYFNDMDINKSWYEGITENDDNLKIVNKINDIIDK